MSSWLASRAAATPGRTALVAGEARHDFAALDREVARAATALRAHGVAPGDTVALLLGNGAPLVVLFHAVLRIGAVLLPLGPRLTAGELAFPLRDAEVRLLVSDAGSGPLAAGAARESGAGGLRVASVEHLAGAPPPAGTSAPPVGACAPAPDAAPGPGDDPDRVVAVLYTSGTSGRPKGARLRAGAFVWNAAATALHLGASPDDRWLACLPLCHVGGLAILARSALGGGAVHLHERFDPVAVDRALERDGITHVSLVPTMLARLLELRGPRPAPPTLRCVLVGGGPLPEPLLARALDRGFPLAPSYGLTEATSQVATQTPEETARRREVTARPLPGVSLRIVDDAGAPCPPDVAGEIVVRTPARMAGYLNRVEASARALRDGWLHTGDVGLLTPDGRLRVLDRRSDLVVSGGENVYPAEVEAALLAHPDVAEAAVAGAPDPDLGQRVVAAVVLRAGAAPDAEALRRFCRARLAGFKVPRAVRFVPALPRTGSGKVLRRAIVSEQAASGRERHG